MKYLLLITLVSSVFFNQKNIIDERKTQIAEFDKTLEFDKKINYSFEHLEGETSYFMNKDKTQKKILMIWDRGSYGKAEREYYIVNDKLIYFCNLEYDWIGIDGSSYSLSENIYYFSDNMTGLKTSQELKTFGENLKDEDRKNLKLSQIITSNIDSTDYQRIVDDLKQFETRKLKAE